MSEQPAPANNNGQTKIDVAVLQAELRSIDRRLGRIEELLVVKGGISERLASLETKVADHDDELRHLKSKSNVWDTLNSLAAMVAVALGIRQ